MAFLSSIVKSITVGISLSLLLAAPAMAGAPAAETLSTGVVKKIDLEQGKITISHGPLAKLEMPPMTMVFRVADPQFLTQTKVNDTIRFEADKVNGAYTVMRIEKAN